MLENRDTAWGALFADRHFERDLVLCGAFGIEITAVRFVKSGLFGKLEFTSRLWGQQE